MRNGPRTTILAAILALSVPVPPIDQPPDPASTAWAPSFNESSGCDQASGTVTPMTTSNDPGRAIPSDHEVRGPWGTYFGRDLGDVSNSLIAWTVPMSGGRSILVNRAALPAFQRVASNLSAHQAAGRYYAIRLVGGFAWRRIGGSNRMSTHSFGTTIDINWDTNPYMSDHPLPGRSGYTDMPSWFVSAWTQAGFCWGGDWLAVKDAMHFSWKGPSATPGYGTLPRPHPLLYAKENFVRQMSRRDAALFPGGAGSLQIVDAGRDGGPDLVAIRRSGANKAYLDILHGFNGFNVCSRERTIATDVPDGVQRLGLDDADSDGRADLIGIQDRGDTTAVWVATHEDRFRSWSRHVIASDFARSDVIRLADFNRDGVNDLYVFDLRARNMVIRVFDGADDFGSGLLHRKRQMPWKASDAFVGSRDGDGIPDVVVIGPDGADRIMIRTGKHRYGRAKVMETAAATGGVLNGLGDWDGDGRDDLFRVSASGLVRVFAGSSNSDRYLFWIRPAGQTCRPTTYPAREWDLDGDHDGEAVVGAPEEAIAGVEAAGHTGIAYGGPSGFSGKVKGLDVNDFEDTEAAEGDLFGSAVASGDFDSNGYADLIIGVPGRDTAGREKAGAVAIYHSGPGGTKPEKLVDASSPGVPGSPGARARFGAALAVGDFDGDGYDDAAIGSPRRDVAGNIQSAGAITILYGAPQLGLGGYRSGYLTQNSPGIDGATSPGDRFGSALAAGDFDGDGFADLAVGSPREDSGAKGDTGIVHILYGGPQGLTGTGSVLISASSHSGRTKHVDDRFGEALAAGDVNGDGKDDLVVGVPGRNGYGAVWVFRGKGSGFRKSLVLNRGILGAGKGRSGDGFGRAVAVLDMDDDGFAEIAIGAPGETADGQQNAGSTYLVDGETAFDSSRLLWRLVQGGGLSGSARPNDELGHMLEAVDIDGDHRYELIIGAPGESITGNVDAGAIHLVGRSGGSLYEVAGSARHQGNGFPQNAEPGDRFGGG